MVPRPRGPVVGDIDCSLQIVREGVNRAFPAPSDFEEIDTYEEDAVTLRTLGLDP